MRDLFDAKMTWAMARERVQGAFVPVVLTSVSAATAWWIAHSVLGHPQPFFAPIAAAITLSTSRIQRARRIVQLVVGVLIGIVISEALTSALGTSVASLGLVVLVTLAVTVLLGAGFIGDGMMFSNQAVASAILVATLRRHGTGAERGLDALVGGGVSLVLGVGLFPAHPLAVLGNGERAVLRAIAARLRSLANILDSGERPDDAWTIEAGFELHGEIAMLERARATAHANVRIAPRRWRLRAIVDAEDERCAHIHLLAASVLGLIRASGRFGRDDVMPGPELPGRLRSLTELITMLAAGPYPWPEELREAVGARARELCEGTRVAGGALTAGMAAAAARDLELLVGSSQPATESRQPPAATSESGFPRAAQR